MYHKNQIFQVATCGLQSGALSSKASHSLGATDRKFPSGWEVSEWDDKHNFDQRLLENVWGIYIKLQKLLNVNGGLTKALKVRPKILRGTLR